MYLIGGGLLVTRDAANPIIENGAVAVEGGVVIRTGGFGELKRLYPEAEMIDAAGGMIMPGLIDAHSHLSPALLRGFARSPAGERFDRPARERAEAESRLTVSDCTYSAYASLMDSLRCGVTTVFALERACSGRNGLLLGVAGAAELLGMRLCLADAVSERCGFDACTAAINENESFIALCENSGSETTAACCGLDAPYTVSEIDLERCVRGNKGRAGFHATAAEDPCDNYICAHAYGKTPVRRLYDSGALDERAILAHCTNICAGDIALIRESGAFAALTPLADLMNGFGRAPAVKLMESGVNICLGTDGAVSDILACAKACLGLLRSETDDLAAAVRITAEMLFENNRRLASQHFKRELGVLREGAAADIVITDHVPFTGYGASSIDEHILLGMSGGSVVTAMINGRLVMRDRRLLNVNEALIRERAKKAADKLWERIRGSKDDGEKLHPIHWSFT